jgi:RNA polymerase sigma-70 factor (ECF subfamily)
VRLCAYLSGSSQAAEDLAQETMAEAWRLRHRLYDPEGFWTWLSAVARNICLRWKRSALQQRSRELAAGLAEGALPELAAPTQPEMGLELERDELAQLLDRAMALLPPDTRQVLVQRYIDELPEEEMAARLGTTEGAVAARLHRGRIALRRVLSTDLRDEAGTYGLVSRAQQQWQATRVWCWQCGRRSLQGRFTNDGTELWLRCPDCCDTPDAVMAHADRPDLFAGLVSHRRAFTLMMTSEGGYHRRALRQRAAPCLHCGIMTPVQKGPAPPDGAPHAVSTGYNVHIACRSCGLVTDLPLNTIALLQPEGQALWQSARRIRTLPERHIAAGGLSVVVVGIEDTGSRKQVDVHFAEDTFELLTVVEAQ